MMSFRDRSHGLEDLPCPLFIHDRKVELRAARALRLLVLAAELAGEQATGEWAPHEQARLFRFQERNELAFEVATGDGVVGLERIEAREVLELGDAKGLGDLPRLPIRDADVADLALSDKRVEGAQGFLDRSHGVVGMNLVEIDVVGLETAKAGFHG